MFELKDYLTSLQHFQDYPAGEKQFQYEFVRLPQLQEIFAPFRLDAVAGDGDTLSKARNIMQWVADQTSYDGGSPLGPALPDKIIDFGIREKNPINCANRSILFCDALVSLGIFAHPVNLEHRPILFKLFGKRKFGDSCHCHVIAQVWLPEESCWAAFDPSFNTFFSVKHDNTSAFHPVSVSGLAMMRETWQDLRSIDNTTGKPAEGEALCTKIGLLDLSVFPGNDFSYRYHFDQTYHLIPQAYLENVQTLKDDDDWEGWAERILHAPKITIDDLEKQPKWKDT